MIQLTPEELAACQEARRFWNHETLDPDLPSHMFSAGLAHARAESAKEIADLNDSLSLAQTHVANLLIVESRLRDKIETLKAQVESQNKTIAEMEEQRDLDYPAYRAQVDGLRKDAERLDWLENSTEEHGFCHIKYGEFRYYAHQRSGFPTVRESIDAAIEQEKSK